MAEDPVMAWYRERQKRSKRYRHLTGPSPAVKPSKTVRAIAARDGWRCRYCLDDLTLATATRDHVIPLSRGGPDHADNLVLACGPCNQAKGSLTAEEYVGISLVPPVREDSGDSTG